MALAIFTSHERRRHRETCMPDERWHLLIHQLPARPLYFRARVRRALAELGAVPLKKAVYALPHSPHGLQQLSRIADDIRAGGGEAYVCEAAFPHARDAEALAAAHRRERATHYGRIVREARTLRAAATA